MAKKIKKSLSIKNPKRTLQRMQTYCNDIVGVINKHQPDPNEAMASVLAVTIRLARSKGTSKAQFMDEAESAWVNLRKLPIDHDQMVVVEEKPWFKQPKVLLTLGLFSGLHWMLFAAYLLRAAS
jgi:hypothetical protein